MVKERIFRIGNFIQPSPSFIFNFLNSKDAENSETTKYKKVGTDWILGSSKNCDSIPLINPYTNRFLLLP